MSFDTILIANRGEIAVRIIKTAKAMGYRTVAVYSEADRMAQHVQLADCGVCLGPAEASESYLNMARVIEAARSSGAGAIHPGYGFLSENAGFAEACQKAGLVFIGPDPDAIRVMGDKALAKRKMLDAGVPCVPGYQGEAQDLETLGHEADRIGFPVMIKASAGGGGKGMRLVETSEEFEACLAQAKSEAKAAFGSDVVLLEKALIAPRHVEIQIFADRMGNTIHLGERDCSVQRRHQKVLEEAPGPSTTPELREAMGASAVAAAQAIGYVGAGTIEFLLDADGAYYFLEMNTRLQVEHPVTELVTGTDLVAWQIAVALGDPLPIVQSEVSLSGWAIEARLCAENPAKGFLPSSGRILLLDLPRLNGVRIDCGVAEGDEVTPFYDPLLAKVIARGKDRPEALRRLRHALSSMTLLGLETNRAFLIAALEEEVFAKGEATTGFVDDHLSPEEFSQSQKLQPDEFALAAAILFTKFSVSRRPRLTHPAYFDLEGEDERKTVRVQRSEEGVAVQVEEQTFLFENVMCRGNNWITEQGGNRREGVFYLPGSNDIWIHLPHKDVHLKDVSVASRRGEHTGDPSVIRAPMHGKVVALEVEQGDAVESGKTVMVLEAMKMQHSLQSAIDGTVHQLFVSAGDQVAVGQILAEISAGG